MLTARLLHAADVRATWGHKIEETWTDHSGKYVPEKHTVRSLAEEWKRLLDDESEETRTLIQEAHCLIAKKCIPDFQPMLFCDAHVEDIMCELRKYLDVNLKTIYLKGFVKGLPLWESR